MILIIPDMPLEHGVKFCLKQTVVRQGGLAFCANKNSEAECE